MSRALLHWKPREVPLLPLIQSFTFMFQGAFLKLACQMYRLPQSKAGDSCYFLTCPPVQPVSSGLKTQGKAVTLESGCERLYKAFSLPFCSTIHLKCQLGTSFNGNFNNKSLNIHVFNTSCTHPVAFGL